MRLQQPHVDVVVPNAAGVLPNTAAVTTRPPAPTRWRKLRRLRPSDAALSFLLYFVKVILPHSRSQSLERGYSIEDDSAFQGPVAESECGRTRLDAK